MWRYYLKLAAISLRKTPVMSLLMMLALGFGTSFLVVLLTLAKTTSVNPLPEKSDRLYAVQLNNWSDATGHVFYQTSNRIPSAVNYRDARAILESGIPDATALLSASGFNIRNPETDQPSELHSGYLVSRDFFSMFEVKFQYGGAWEGSGRYNGIHKVVLSNAVNHIFFDGENSVGKILELDNRTYQVAGVLDADWRLVPKIYDVQNNPFGAVPGVWVPWEDISVYDYPRWGGWYWWEPREIEGHQDFLQSEILWTKVWVELPAVEQKQSFEDFLSGYLEQEHDNGRYSQSTDYYLHTIDQWMEIQTGAANNGDLMLSGLFFLICALNAVGLLSAKFLRKTQETGIRRALGASRTAVFLQHFCEAFLIGLGGSLLGLLLSFYWMHLFNQLYTGYNYEFLKEFAVVNGYSVLVASVMALVACIVTGLVPALRISRAAPVRYLKVE